jgi:hypothetical protein
MICCVVSTSERHCCYTILLRDRLVSIAAFALSSCVSSRLTELFIHAVTFHFSRRSTFYHSMSKAWPANALERCVQSYLLKHSALELTQACLRIFLFPIKPVDARVCVQKFLCAVLVNRYHSSNMHGTYTVFAGLLFGRTQ